MDSKQQKIKQVMEAIKQRKSNNKHPFTGRKHALKPVDLPPNENAGLGKLLSKEERQIKVKELLRRGQPISLIAKYLDVSERTIRRDKQDIRQQMRQQAIEADPWEKIGDTIDFFEEIAEKAMYHFTIEENASHKNGFLNTAMKARQEAARFQLETGTIPRASDKREISVQINGINIEKMTTEELLEHKKTLLKKMDRNKLTNTIEGEIISRESFDV